MSNPGVREDMLAITRGQRGIPVIRLNGEIAIGLDRRWMKERLGLL